MLKKITAVFAELNQTRKEHEWHDWIAQLEEMQAQADTAEELSSLHRLVNATYTEWLDQHRDELSMESERGDEHAKVLQAVTGDQWDEAAEPLVTEEVPQHPQAWRLAGLLDRLELRILLHEDTMVDLDTEEEAMFWLEPLLEDVWEGITTIWPEYRDADLPLLQIDAEWTEDCEACYNPPQPHDLDFSVIRLNPNHTEEEVAGPVLAHELTHHLQYLRGKDSSSGDQSRPDFLQEEQEAYAMRVALFWDYEPGEWWRELEEKGLRPDWDGLVRRRIGFFEKMEKKITARGGARQATGN